MYVYSSFLSIMFYVKSGLVQWSGPSDHGILCSRHLDSSSYFEPESELASQTGMQKCRRLKEELFLLCFERPESFTLQQLSETGPSTLS